MPDNEYSVLRFGVFELDRRSGELRRSGVLVRLQPQPFKALAFLASRPRLPVTREELQKEIWGDDVNVDFEQGLNHCIKQVRDALGDDAEAPRYVETLPKIGYRFIAPVERLGLEVEPAPPARPAQTAAPPLAAPLPKSSQAEASSSDNAILSVKVRLPSRRPTPPEARARRLWLRASVAIAVVLALGVAAYLVWRWPQLRPWISSPAGKVMLVVVPFDNLSAEPEQEYFCQGVTEEITTQLGRARPDRLGVFARATALQVKGKSITETGRLLKVQYVLEGSCRKAGSSVVITAQLIQVEDETHLWAESYEEKLEDVLAIQREVTRRVVESVIGVLLPAERPKVNPDAQDAYWKGRYYWNHRTTSADLLKSIEFYERAIEADPNYALAHAAMAEAYTLLAAAPYNAALPRDAGPRAQAAARRALEIDPNLAEAHAALAQVEFAYEWDWKTAEKEFQRALELNSNYASAHQWYAELLWATQRPDPAYAQIQRAQELDPLSLVIQVSVGRHYYYQHDFERAIREFRDSIEMAPNFFLGHLYLGLAYSQVNRPEEAIVEFERALETSGHSPLALAALAYARARAGHKAEAGELLNRLRAQARTRHVPAVYFAGVYTGLGDKDQAFGWLEKAYEERSDYLVYLQIEPTFDPLHDDPRFRDLVRRLSLPAR
ncbi:MAG TPA: winged helix-turn-helix domain-containing protein [Candidatus Xenobia bacterium]|nr:winged helix-turn-helix domain-containing protein [Candidatus Xenobia bacterium]